MIEDALYALALTAPLSILLAAVAQASLIGGAAAITVVVTAALVFKRR